MMVIEINTIYNLTNLSYLNLGYNKLNRIDQDAFRMNSNLTNLNVLLLDNNEINDIEIALSDCAT